MIRAARLCAPIQSAISPGPKVSNMGHDLPEGPARSDRLRTSSAPARAAAPEALRAANAGSVSDMNLEISTANRSGALHRREMTNAFE
jgi:hypothetical protein